MAVSETRLEMPMPVNTLTQLVLFRSVLLLPSVLSLGIGSQQITSSNEVLRLVEVEV